MAKPNRGFTFNIAPSDPQLRAIGTVVVMWSHLENLLAVCAHVLAGDDTDQWAQYLALPNFKRRLRMMRELCAIKMEEPHKSWMLSIIDRTGQTQAERDKIVHGQWAFGVTDENSDEAYGVFDSGMLKKSFDWKAPYSKIMETAYKIDKISSEIIMLSFKYQENGTPPTLGDALRRTLRK